MAKVGDRVVMNGNSYHRGKKGTIVQISMGVYSIEMDVYTGKTRELAKPNYDWSANRGYFTIIGEDKRHKLYNDLVKEV